MVQEIVAGAVFWLNVFPPKSGISKTFGPRTIVIGTHIDYKRHCTMECGQYVETHEPTDNTMNERTCPAIFLRTNGNEQGGAFFMSLRTGKRLNRQAWTVIPMPDTVVDGEVQLEPVFFITRGFHFWFKKELRVQNEWLREVQFTYFFIQKLSMKTHEWLSEHLGRHILDLGLDLIDS
jgi:hypothetical protein